MKSSPLDAIIGAKIKESRERNGLSQQEVSERMGTLGHPMHQSTVAKLEAGKRPILVSEMLAFQIVLAQPDGSLLP